MRLLWRAVCALTLGLSACVGGVAPPAPSAAIIASNYEIGPGDVLTVFVWRNPELSVDVTVRPDGRLSLPLVDDIDAAGRTPRHWTHKIEGRRARYISCPIGWVLTWAFLGPRARKVRISGEA